MEIQFFKITDAPEKVNKTLGSGLSVQGTCRSELDVFSPEIVLGTDVSDYNYMYIPYFSRYYYINGCVIVNNGLYKVTGVHEDVLMSLKNQFLMLNAIVDKSALYSVGDEYINDGSFIASSRTFDKVINFPVGFNDRPDFILVTAGGYFGTPPSGGSGGGGSSSF